MEQTEKSPHGWLIITLIIFTLCVFLMIMLYSVDGTEIVLYKRVKNVAVAQTSPPEPVPLLGSLTLRKGDKILNHHEKTNLSKESIRKYVHSFSIESPDKFELHNQPVSSVSFGKEFFIYDVKIVPTSSKIIVTILIELPSIEVVIGSGDYSKLYPLINPYIHVAELTFEWNFNMFTYVMNDSMKLKTMKLFMVNWENNRYNNTYIQTKNSPLFMVNIPEPFNLSEDELHTFIINTGIFEEIPIVAEETIYIEEISASSSTPITNSLNDLRTTQTLINI